VVATPIDLTPINLTTIDLTPLDLITIDLIPKTSLIAASLSTRLFRTTTKSWLSPFRPG
jgi:hypothetical protein